MSVEPSGSHNAKESMLRRIREANQSKSSEQAAMRDWNGIARGYHQTGRLQVEQRLQLFEDRLRDYDATITRCFSSNVSQVVQRRLHELCIRHVVVPAGFPAEWLPHETKIAVDHGLSVSELDAVGGVLTGASLAIAETGTIVLQHGPGQGRRAASLVPDYHLCVVQSDRVVECVAEAIRYLQPTCELPTTFISGPSATADIEMTRIKGVHGPRTLDVLLVVDSFLDR